jgi:hypothetical protein
MARPKRVTQSDENGGEFDTDVLEQESTPEKVVTRTLDPRDQEKVIKEVLETQKSEKGLISVTFQGTPRSWSQRTLDLMLKAYPNDIFIDGVKVAVGKCAGCGQ